jgi:hypothetical protein
MSNYTGEGTELLYSFAGVGTQLNTFTTEANLMGAYPLCPIPVGYFASSGGTMSHSLKVKASGRLGGTTPPTFVWTLRLIASTTWSAGGISLGANAAITAGTVTLAPWFLEVDIVMRTAEVIAATAPTLGVVYAMGEVRGPKALASPFAVTIPDNNVTPTNTSYDANAQYYLFLSATCGTSVSTNLIQLEMLKVYAEN